MSIDIGHIQSQKREIVSIQQRKVGWKGKSFNFSKKLSPKRKGFIYKDMAILIKAGIDFKTTLTIIRDQQKNEYVISKECE